MHADYLIVGGGIIGLATAWELRERGLRISVLERGACGAESSWAGGGILSQLLPWDYTPAVSQLAQYSARLYPGWIEQIRAASGIDPEYQVSGALVTGKADRAHAEAWCREHGVRLERIAVRDKAPMLRQGGHALWLPEVAQVRNPRLMKSLKSALIARGVEFRENVEVTGWHVDGSRVSAAITSTGEIAAGGFIVCCGAWSRGVLGEQALALSIWPVRGQMLLYQGEPGWLSTIILDDDVYLIPRRDGHILVGSTLEEVGYDKSITPQARQMLAERAAGLVESIADLPLIRHWAGLRPGSPGNVPTIGCHPGIGNLYVNSGHFRYGVTMAPGSARLLAALIHGEPPQLDLRCYDWPLAAGS